MAGRTIWKGRIALEGLDVAVKLHSAVREERVSFHLLHRSDGVRLKQQLTCAFENVPVPAGEQVRGFEWEKGRYLLVDSAELERTLPPESRSIEVHEFVKTSEIDPIFLERVYYLEPEISAKGYQALVKAMEELDVSGICTWTMRKRSYLGALQVRDGLLRLNTLRYADEIIPVQALELPDIPLSERELKIGIDLINQLSAPFEPEKFVNEHQQKVRNLIDQKVRGEKVRILRPRRLEPTAPDKLLEALEASLRKVA